MILCCRHDHYQAVEHGPQRRLLHQYHALQSLLLSVSDSKRDMEHVSRSNKFASVCLNLI